MPNEIHKEKERKGRFKAIKKKDRKTANLFVANASMKKKNHFEKSVQKRGREQHCFGYQNVTLNRGKGEAISPIMAIV